MKENTQEKSMVKINENSIFYKIKTFFRNLFYKETAVENTIVKETKNIIQENKKTDFIESIKNIESEETKILKLQKQYRNGDIKEEEMSEKQISALMDLYDKQIANLKKSNELRKQKLLEYRRKIQTDN